jgi:hypothetical protein
MKDNAQIPSWKVFAAVGLALCLVALLAHPVAGYSLAALILAPVLLFGLVLVPRSLWPAADPGVCFAPRVLARAHLFQRPPPRFSR